MKKGFTGKMDIEIELREDICGYNTYLT